MFEVQFYASIAILLFVSVTVYTLDGVNPFRGTVLFTVALLCMLYSYNIQTEKILHLSATLQKVLTHSTYVDSGTLHWKHDSTLVFQEDKLVD